MIALKSNMAAISMETNCGKKFFGFFSIFFILFILITINIQWNDWAEKWAKQIFGQHPHTRKKSDVAHMAAPVQENSLAGNSLNKLIAENQTGLPSSQHNIVFDIRF